MATYEVFVQWERGSPHQHAETINASDPEMALTLAKRNVDVRLEPLNIWVTEREDITETDVGDSTLSPSTDRSYRSIEWYAQNQIEVNE